MRIAVADRAEQKLSRINELAEQIATENGLVLLDIRIGQQGKIRTLVVTIYRKLPPISFADCERMSRALESKLEEEETCKDTAINGPYILEVVSAGIERQLTTPFELSLFAGEQVKIAAKQKIGGFGNEFVGTLLGGDESTITIDPLFPLPQKAKKGKEKNWTREDAGQKVTIDRQQIYRVCLWPGSKDGF